MTPTRQQLVGLLRLVLETEPEELDCDRFLERVGPLLEGLEDGGERPPELALASRHLEVCAECREEFDALVRVYGLTSRK